ncbi:transketolase [Treponema sp. OMZ 840]|uniref:transketolase n=1 Tax=Treponema sp. OMZ 840 TaxID=244313 RepID=UPI003D8A4663
MDTEYLKEKARQIRCDSLRMISQAGSGHPGGSLSAADIMVALYYSKMKLSDNPQDESRDRFVLSKGHANPPYYAILADKGYFPKTELQKLRRLHSILQGHPDCNKCPGVDCSTGSLGQGISVAVGMALGFRLAKKANRVYVLTGDGELQEGLAWEAFMAASHYRLDNLTVLVDNNRLQLDGPVTDILSLGDLKAKFGAFGFSVREVNGHCYDELLAALDTHEKDKPLCIICNTVKGKGVSFMENKLEWHGKALSAEQLEQALNELERK